MRWVTSVAWLKLYPASLKNLTQFLLKWTLKTQKPHCLYTFTMTEKFSKTENFVYDVLEKVKNSGFTASSTETAGRELANLLNTKNNDEASNELSNVINILFDEAVSDATKIDSYVYVFQQLFILLSNQIQDKQWAPDKADEIPGGRHLAILKFGAILREGIDDVSMYLSEEFIEKPNSDHVISTEYKIDRVLTINDARSKFINVNSLIGRLWVLDVMNTSKLAKMLLRSYCNLDNRSSNNELDDKILYIESMCALICAASEKLELSINKTEFSKNFEILEKIFQQPDSSFFLKVKIAKTLKLYDHDSLIVNP